MYYVMYSDSKCCPILIKFKVSTDNNRSTPLQT